MKRLLTLLLLSTTACLGQWEVGGRSFYFSLPNAYTLVQQVQGNQSNQAATCGTYTSTTCNVTGTISAGHLLLITAHTNINPEHIVSVGASSACGTFIPVRGNSYTDYDTHDKTSNSGTVIEGYIYPSSACTNPVVTFSGAMGSGSSQSGEVTIAEYSFNAGTPTEIAYNTDNTTLTTSPFPGVALSCPTGGSIAQIASGKTNSSTGTSAVASPWDTNATFPVVSFFQAGISSLISTTCPQPSWTSSGTSETTQITAGLAFGLSGTPCTDSVLIDWSGLTNGTTMTNAAVTASALGYVGGGNAGSGTPFSGASTGLTGSTAHFWPFNTAISPCGGGGGSSTGRGNLVAAWATGTTPQIVVQQNLNTTVTRVYTGRFLEWNIPVTAINTQYSQPEVNNGIDEIDLNVNESNTAGTSNPLYVECTNSPNNPIFLANGAPNTLYYYTTWFVNTVPATATFTSGSASIAVTNTAQVNDIVWFSTSGTLPTGFSAKTNYYVISTGLSGSAMEVSATKGGSAIVPSSSGSGTQTFHSTATINLYSVSGSAGSYSLTSVASGTCGIFTGGGNGIAVGLAGVSGSEIEQSGDIIWQGAVKIDLTGSTEPIL